MTENTKTKEIDSEVQNNTEFSEAQKEKEYQEFKEVLAEINAELAVEEQYKTDNPLTEEEKIEQNIEKVENNQEKAEDNQRIHARGRYTYDENPSPESDAPPPPPTSKA